MNTGKVFMYMHRKGTYRDGPSVIRSACLCLRIACPCIWRGSAYIGSLCTRNDVLIHMTRGVCVHKEGIRVHKKSEYRFVSTE